MNPARQELYTFLLSAFSESDLPRFIRNYLEDAPMGQRPVTESLTRENLSLSSFANQFVDVLQEDGKPTMPELAEALRKVRGGRVEDIDTVFAAGPRRPALLSLLTSLFDQPGLERFIKFDLGRQDQVDRIRRTVLFTTALDGLIAHDMIDKEFWDSLKQVRRRRVAEIEEIRQRWAAAQPVQNGTKPAKQEARADSERTEEEQHLAARRAAAEKQERKL